MARIARTMHAAQLNSKSLVSTLPQPPRRQPGSDHAEVVHRLVFEDVSLEALTRFCHALAAANPEFRIPTMHLRAGADEVTWSAEVGVSYWILAPG